MFKAYLSRNKKKYIDIDKVNKRANNKIKIQI